MKDKTTMNYRLIKFFALVLITLVSAQVAAQDTPPPTPKGIDINVKGGARRVLMPLAVPDATEPDGSTRGVAAKVNETLRRDLEFSGFFKVLPNDSFFFDPSKEGMAPAEINFQNWFNVGAQGLIKSSVRTSGDSITLDLRLYQVDKGTPIKLKWSPETTKREGVEATVHAFANAVVEYYTGVPGIFGTRLAYVARQKGGVKHVYTMGIDGTGTSRVSKHDAINILPTWGPGGTVYYTSYADQNPDLWMSSGGKVSKLSSQRGQNSGAAYCKGKLALTLSMGGENADIYLIDPKKGGVVKRLTDHWAIDTSPTWSPDCSKIAFVSSRSGGPQIYTMNGDGSDQKRLTFQGTYNTSPDWSPKGDLIAFTARDERARFDIFTVTTEGTVERLTQNQGNNQDPSFSPDGRYLVFTSDRGGKGDRIWLMTGDGEVQKLVTTSGSGFTSPVWEH